MSEIERSLKYRKKRRDDRDHLGLVTHDEATGFDDPVNLTDPLFVVGGNINLSVVGTGARISRTIYLRELVMKIRIKRPESVTDYSNIVSAAQDCAILTSTQIFHVYLVNFRQQSVLTDMKVADFITRATSANNKTWQRNLDDVARTNIMLHKRIEITPKATMVATKYFDPTIATTVEKATLAAGLAVESVDLYWKGNLPMQYLVGVNVGEPPQGNRPQLFILPEGQDTLDWGAFPWFVQWNIRTRFVNGQ